jgi:hypothetical protein
MSSLKYVPYDLFSHCTNLTDLEGCFRSCTNLGTKLSAKNKNNVDIPCIMTTGQDTSYFTTNFNNVTNAQGMFWNCKKLPFKAKDIAHLLAALPNLQKGRGIFYQCEELKELPDETFKNNCKIKELDVCFSKSGLESLPN